jgi:hypothetical protein
MRTPAATACATAPAADATQSLLQTNRLLLDQALALVLAHQRPGAPDYERPVGVHLRHVIEHFEALLDPPLGAVVDYDARPRDRRLERDPAHACSRLLALDDRLRSLGREQLSRGVTVRGLAGLDGELAFVVGSTVARELAFVASHAVHHFALLLAHCEAHHIAVDESFGTAPATRAHARLQPAAGEPMTPSHPPTSPLRTRRRPALRAALGAAAGALMASWFASPPAQAAEPPINTLKNSFFSSRTDTAINGYDTVAYFTVGRPVKGQDSFVTEWMGAKWKFASAANLALFKADPVKYAPQYGGYCAYGVAQGSLVKVEPEQFTVRDGKLFLNYDADIQAKWLADPARFIQEADRRFQSLLR